MNQQPNILLIYTGGTIGMVQDSDTGVLKAFDFRYMEEHMPELRHIGCNIEVIQFEPPIDSSDVGVDLWMRIAQTIRDNQDNFDGFVVLHGTDTMAYSASAVSFLLPNLTKTVVFTGSQLPIGMLRTDGKENLITALEIALAKKSDGSSRIPEVVVYFNEHLMRGNRVTKDSAEHFDAFKSHNYPELAYSGIDIKYRDKYVGFTPAVECLDPPISMDQHVVVLRLFPGILPEVVESVLKIDGLKGVVLETYGSGNAPTYSWFIDSLERAIKRGVLIVNVTQCASGAVAMERYAAGSSLSHIGVVNGSDMTTECALTKLMYLFGLNHPSSRVAELMELPLRGELTPVEPLR